MPTAKNQWALNNDFDKFAVLKSEKQSKIVYPTNPHRAPWIFVAVGMLCTNAA